MTYSKIVDSKTTVSVYKYDHDRFQVTVGSSFGFLSVDEVRELVEYLKDKPDGK